ncbi:hypothetical protein [Sutcliffiella rhizosphaerae]|nr:hypothetical protein [Sutcliffiella rhizosphaerae]
MKPFELVVDFLGELVDESSPEFTKATLKSFQTVVITRKGQEEIVNKIRDIQNRILDEVGYFTEEDLRTVSEYTESFSKGQFIIAVTQLENEEEVKKTISWLEEVDSSKEDLIKLLKESVGTKAMNILRKAHSVHLKDYDGNKVSYSSEENGADKWIEVYRDMVNKSTQKNLLPYLRN